ELEQAAVQNAGAGRGAADGDSPLAAVRVVQSQDRRGVEDVVDVEVGVCAELRSKSKQPAHPHIELNASSFELGLRRDERHGSGCGADRPRSARRQVASERRGYLRVRGLVVRLVQRSRYVLKRAADREATRERIAAIELDLRLRAEGRHHAAVEQL